jgi:hypothetical protein
LIDSHNTADSVASMKVCVALDENPFGIFTDKGSTVEQAVNEFYTFVSLEDTTLGMETAYVSTFTIHGDSYVERVTMEGGILYQSTEWSGMVGDGTFPTYLQGSEITWYDTSDTTLQG